MNKTIITGNLGSDAEIKQTKEGRQYLSFSVAVSDGKDKPTTWFSASAWADRFINSKLIDYMKKGTKVLVDGKYVPTAWSREDGTPDVSHNILVNDIELMGSANSQSQDPPVQPPLRNAATPTEQNAAHFGSRGVPTQPATGAATQVPAQDDDLPF